MITDSTGARIAPADPELLVPQSDDPWVSDLESSFGSGQCQSTVGFDNHQCEGEPAWYVELEVWERPVANPRWEGKLCQSCLSGWLEWAAEEPDSVRVVSVNPIVTGA